MKLEDRRNQLDINLGNIPEEMKDYPQWVCWKAEPRGSGKITKIPIDPISGKHAKTNDPNTWSRFENAETCYHSNGHAGVGFVFTENDDFVGIDLDDCIDPNSGKIDSDAEEIIRQMQGYTEISPSGRGVHIIVKGNLPGAGRRTDKTEIYDKARYFTITGDLLNGSTAKIENRNAELQKLYQRVSGQPEETLEDEIIEKACKARNGNKFKRLWTGDYSEYPSQSEADLALCKMLAFWTKNDTAEIDRLFRQSGLYRDKWDKSHYGDGRTYGKATIARAIELTGSNAEYDSAVQASLTKGFNLTDMGNAERLVHHFGSEIRYCHAWKKWLIWDGKRWAVDKTEQIKHKAKEVVRRIYRDAEHQSDDRKRQDIAKHAMSSESEKRIRSMVSLAQSEAFITPEELDLNPWLLTCLNGTINLETGKLMPHQTDHFISQLAPVNYDQDMDCPLWLSFLDRIMDGNEHLISFLQRAIGYSLTGETSEQCLFIFYGSGANGKTTFLQTINSMLGEYAMQTPTETLLIKRRGAIPNDVARLKGARFVTASEAESEQRFAESLIKQMTGGDTLSARFLHQEWFDFEPTHKIFLGTNHKPVIRGTDHAIWRRIKLVPFEVTIPENERDLRLIDKLKTELPGILAWAVKGCLKWQENGLGTPDEVKTATEDYRNEMDVLSDFLNDCCIEGPSLELKTKDLYPVYCNWCERNGDRPLAKRTLGLKLKERGFLPAKVNPDRSRGWSGIGLRT
jgi:putative DNA primase/helicase